MMRLSKLVVKDEKETILWMDERGRITLPFKVKPQAFVPVWVDNSLYLLDSILLMRLFATVDGDDIRIDYDKYEQILTELEQYRIKNMPIQIPNTVKPTKKITLPKVLRITNYWVIESCKFKFKSVDAEVPAYKLTPVRIKIIKEVIKVDPSRIRKN